MSGTITELEDTVNCLTSSKSRSDKEKEKLKDVSKDGMFGIFKKNHGSGQHSPAEAVPVDEQPSPPSTTSADPYHHIQSVIGRLKKQHAALTSLIPFVENNPSTVHASPLPSTVEEHSEPSDSPATRFTSPIARRAWMSTATSLSDKFFLDTPPLEACAADGRIAGIDGQSNSHNSEEASDTDEEKDERPSLAISEYQATVAGPVADEGSLFAVFKKNVGKDLSSIAFPVTFNEPLTLLQRTAEEVEYYDLLSEASQTRDPVERMCYVAAFAVSGYAHTRHRSSRKGFNPLLAETFEIPRLKFISEKVSHHPVVMAYHAEGEGLGTLRYICWEDKILGLEIIPLGINHVKIGNDHYQWRKPSSFMRNLMMGTKYLEHTGKMTIENCLDWSSESGYWGVPNQVYGTVYSPTGDIETTLEGKWDEVNAQDLYGFTSWGITLNEITPGMEGKLPPTDSRYRPDVRALEEGYLDRAEAEKERLEELQRERRRLGKDREPQWFRCEGDEWVYAGGYWEQRAKGWKAVDPLW
ncbi:hypothetical protein EDB83DRAFT_2352578 [Lactarius deliciosus]|nr:hypothetical protein EDB83DRAFT_2352578 [Lactarius deliciosus]